MNPIVAAAVVTLISIGNVMGQEDAPPSGLITLKGLAADGGGADQMTFTLTKKVSLVGTSGAVHPSTSGTLIGIGLSTPPRLAYHVQTAATQTYSDGELKVVALPDEDTYPVVRASLAVGDDLLFLGSAYVDGQWVARQWIVEPSSEKAQRVSLLSADGSGSADGPRTEGRDLAISSQGGYFSLVQIDDYLSPAGRTGSFFQIVSPYGWNYIYSFGAGVSTNDGRVLVAREGTSTVEELIVGGSQEGSAAITFLSAQTGEQSSSQIISTEPSAINAITRLADGMLLAGEIDFGASRDALLVRVDSEMNALWVRVCGGLEDDVATSVKVMGEHIVVGGGTRSHLRSEETPSPGAVLTPWVLLLDLAGSVEAEEAVEEMGEVGPIVALAPWNDSSAIVVAQGGSIGNLEVVKPTGAETAPNWSGPNTWTRGQFDGFFAGDGPILPRYALTCVDAAATANAVLAIEDPASINIETAIADRRFEK